MLPDGVDLVSSALVLLLLLLGLALALRRHRRLPPGPWGLPLIGYLPWLDPARPHESLAALARRYGPIYSMSMGGVLTVVLTDEKLVRAAFAKEECAGRAPLYLTHGLMQGHGLICAEGVFWRDQRRLVAGCLKNLGMVKVGPRRGRLEARIMSGVQAAVQALCIGGGGPGGMDPHAVLTDAVGNVVNDVVFGRTWAKDDPTWVWLQRIQDEGTKLIGVAGPINFLPCLRIIPYFSRTIVWLKEGQKTQHALYADLVQAALQKMDDVTSDADAAPNNILDAWLQERRRRAADGEEAARFYTDRQLHHLLADLFGAGLDTTVTTLRWLLLMVAAHPDVQDHVQRELDEVLGGRAPTLDDMNALPYTQATIAETQRIRSVTPLGIPHGVRQDTTIGGYAIPRGAMIVPLQWAVHMDPNRWKQPEVFRPERFLASDGSLDRPEGFIPFQTGKRMCVGDEWARMMLFLFCAGVLQQLRLSPSDNHRLDLEGVCGITLSPKDHKLRCVRRLVTTDA